VSHALPARPRRVADEYRRSLRNGTPMRRTLAMAGGSTAAKPWWDDFWYSAAGASLSRSAAGQSVTADSALTISAVYRAVRLLSDDVAQLPLHLFTLLPDRAEGRPGGKARRRDSLAEVLGKQPNPRQTSFEFRQQMTANLLLRGNAYARIVSGARGFVDRLEPLPTVRIRPELLDTGRVLYRYRKPNGTEERLTQDEVFHLRGFNPDPEDPSGVSVIGVARTSLGLTMSTEEFGARQFSQTPKPSFILTSPNDISVEKRKEYEASFRAMTSGPDGWGGAPMMDKGMTAVSVGMNHEDAQFLETRVHQVSEVARWFGVPPTMLGDLSHGTYANVEQEALAYVTHGLMPWLTLWEQSIKRDLVLDDAFAEFAVGGLLRGDAVSRAQSNQIMHNGTALTANEWRARENLPPVPWGDEKPATQGAPAPAQPGRGPGTPPPKPGKADDDDKAANPFALANRLGTNGNGSTA